MSGNRNQEGRYSEKVTSEVVLEVFDHASDPVLTVKEVADRLGVSSETARRRLNDLLEEGKIKRKDVGSRAVVWWKVT